MHRSPYLLIIFDPGIGDAGDGRSHNLRISQSLASAADLTKRERRNMGPALVIAMR